MFCLNQPTLMQIKDDDRQQITKQSTFRNPHSLLNSTFTNTEFLGPNLKKVEFIDTLINNPFTSDTHLHRCWISRKSISIQLNRPESSVAKVKLRIGKNNTVYYKQFILFNKTCCLREVQQRFQMQTFQNQKLYQS